MLKLNIDIDGMKKKKGPTFLKRIARYLQSIGVYEFVDEIKYSFTNNKNGKIMSKPRLKIMPIVLLHLLTYVRLHQNKKSFGKD